MEVESNTPRSQWSPKQDEERDFVSTIWYPVLGLNRVVDKNICGKIMLGW